MLDCLLSIIIVLKFLSHRSDIYNEGVRTLELDLHDTAVVLEPLAQVVFGRALAVVALDVDLRVAVTGAHLK
jgi:hypothetical protein